MLPELNSLYQTGALVRIPPAQDVPLSARVRRILDTAPMRRLATISQLGMVALVYPGATHSRLEHSLGVYDNAIKLLARFAGDDRFTSIVEPRMAEAFAVASLVHDIGHWPFCHPIEDMRLADLGEHEDRIAGWIESTELADCIDQDWQCSIDDIVGLLCPSDSDQNIAGKRFLASALSGPIDVDKLDYLQRDSLHAGVPYGRNFDAGRLIASMAVHPDTGSMAIGQKGRTAAEMMVFSRYVMFSEVYWHHSVRAATAMLQRSVFLLQNRIDLPSTLHLGDADWIANLRRAASGSVAEPLVDGLFGPRRRLYKRAAEFDVMDGAAIHGRLARQPYWYLVACAEALATAISRDTGLAVHPVDVLIDAPPVKLEVDINIDVVARDDSYRSLGDVSPVAAALARDQFDNQVKRVRVFLRSDLRSALMEKSGAPNLNDNINHWMQETMNSVESNLA